jgi:diguanylate cyclase (GGDEF)-like protein
VLVGSFDFTTAAQEYIDKHLPGYAIFVAKDAVETVQTMHHLDRSAVFIVEDIWPDIDSRLLITQNIRRTFRFDSTCFVATDDEERVKEFSRSRIRCFRRNKPCGCGGAGYNFDAFFIAEIFYAVEKLKELRVDPLTKIYTSTEMMKRWERDFQLARLNKSTTALLFGDLNDLKWVNDTYGHLAADSVAEAVGRVFREEHREPYDIPCRLYAGDEFAILMPATKLRGAEKVQARIEVRLAELSIEIDPNVFTTPVMAFGIAILRPDELGRSATDAFEKMFKSAEKKAYRNKLAYYEGLASSGDERGKVKYQQLLDIKNPKKAKKPASHK